MEHVVVGYHYESKEWQSLSISMGGAIAQREYKSSHLKHSPDLYTEVLTQEDQHAHDHGYTSYQLNDDLNRPIPLPMFAFGIAGTPWDYVSPHVDLTILGRGGFCADNRVHSIGAVSLFTS